MPANTYFRSAAAEIRKAALEKRHEADQLKKEMTEREQTTRQYVDQLKSDKNQKERIAGSGSMSNDQRAQLEREAQENLAQVAQTQQALSSEKDTLRKTIASLEQEVRDLEKLAQSFETRQ